MKQNDGEKILRAWRAGMTRRWHSNPDLCDTVDPDCAHQGRVALLALLLFPAEASRALLIHAIAHDQGEAGPGDISYDAKKASPALREESMRLEAEEIAAQGIDLPPLTDRENKIVKLCDWLDAWLWMMRHARHLNKRGDWLAQRGAMMLDAAELGVGDTVHRLLTAEMERT